MQTQYTGKDSKGRAIIAETQLKPSELKTPKMAGVVRNRTLIDMAVKGEDGVPVSTLVKLVKSAYSYEQWETFDSLMESVTQALEEVDDPRFNADRKALEILVVSCACVHLHAQVL